LEDLKTRTAKVADLIRHLNLTAPHAGVVLPPPARQAQVAENQLGAWSGTPLDPANRGSFLETGTLVCRVARRGEIEAVAIVDQAEVPLMQPGRAAWLAFPQWPQGALEGAVEQVARIESDQLPINLAASGALPQRMDAGGQARSLQTTYQVRIRLASAPQRLLPGAAGRVQISAPPQTIAARIRRWLARTFRFGS
jgi:hypothetical protein